MADSNEKQITSSTDHEPISRGRFIRRTAGSLLLSLVANANFIPAASAREVDTDQTPAELVQQMDRQWSIMLRKIIQMADDNNQNVKRGGYWATDHDWVVVYEVTSPKADSQGLYDRLFLEVPENEIGKNDNITEMTEFRTSIIQTATPGSGAPLGEYLRLARLPGDQSPEYVLTSQQKDVISDKDQDSSPTPISHSSYGPNVFMTAYMQQAGNILNGANGGK